MSIDSYLDRLERWPDTVLDAPKPVSTYRGYATRNNLQHLVNMAPQYRVNWCPSTSTTEEDGAAAAIGTSRLFRFIFPWTQISAGYMANLDLRIHAHTAGGTASILAYVFAGIQDASAPVSHLVWSTSSATSITETSSTLKIDDVVEQSDMEESLTPQKAYEPHVAYQNYSAASYAYSDGHYATLMITLTADGSNAAYLSGVHVREYAQLP